MEPLLSHGDEVRVRAPDLSPRRGALVAVELAGAVAIHLVVACDGEQVVTQGLHAARPDPPSPVRALIGEVDAWRQQGGTWRGMSWRIGIVLLALVSVRRRVGGALRALAGRFPRHAAS